MNVTGNGFPAGTIPGASVSVTITCPPGNGGAVTVNSTSVTNVLSQKTIYFTVPAALTVNQPVACQVTVAGTTPSAYNSSPSSSTLTLNPPATIYTVSPGAGTQASVLNNIAITGNFTHFKNIQPAQPTVTVGGTGVTVSNVNATDDTHLTATFAISLTAAPGIRSVTVQNGSETSTIANGFLVSINPPVTIAISPQTGLQGTTLDLHITGTNTTFAQGTSIVSLGDGVKMNSLTVADTTHATANITIDPIAYTGFRTVTITTGGEYGTLANGFTITPSPAALTSILPTGAPQGTNATVTFTGNLTHWVPSGSKVSMGGGIVVGNVTVSNNQSLTANLSVPSTTAPGSYNATVATNGEVVTLPNAFTVTAATPHLTNINPTAGSQGQTLDVAVTGQFTTFTALPAPTFNFGPNITVNTVTVTDDTHAKANITISNTAFAGGRTASLTSNGTIFNFSFTVNSSTAVITGINPTSGYQGAAVAIQVSGSNTHWVDGLTTASLDPIWITINRVKVTSATSAEVDISIAGNAPVGARTLTLSTGGEIVTFNSFNVLPYTPTMSVNPGSGMIGTTVPVVFNGSFTHWVDQVTVANIDGQGVSITGFKVDSPWTAHASLVIDPTAPSNGCVPGNRTLTLTTVQGAVDEIVTSPFCVTSTPAYLTNITPNHSPAGVNNLVVDIYGAFTHFDNTTTVGFGPNITLVGNPFIFSPTHLQVVINIGANPPTALGWRQVFVNSACASCVPVKPEQLTIGFNIDYPATSSLVSISPSTAAQGQALSGVTITGNLTQWNATTEAIVGLGITVGNLHVVNPTTATVDISVSPTTPVGGRTVSMITNGGGEVESGLGFSVTPSIASVVAVGIGGNCQLATNCPAPNNTIADINQGDTKSFRVVGTATHFLDGETTLDFGPGVSITQVHVVDNLNLYGQITVSFQATTGFRSFRAITDGEIAPSFTNAVDIHPVTGTINITPTTAPQGTTLDITVNGVGSTHFTAGNTTATFGNNSGVIGKFGGTTNLSGADVTVMSSSQVILHVIVQGTAYCCTPAGYRDLQVTTSGVVNPPTNLEQITLPLAFFISQGAGIVTNVTPTSDYQGHSVQINVTGQNTNFTNGVTTAYLTTGGCNPASPAGAVVTNVTVTDALHASLAVAIDVAASPGVRGLCMFTLGESVGYLNAFNVLPGIPTLTQVGPVSGLQGQSLTAVTLAGNFTHWTAAGNTPTTVTFGQGITVSNLNIVDATHATVNLVIDPLAQLGGRTVTVTTGNEVVSGNLFSVNAGPAILSTISPTHGNQGQQHILMQINGNFTHWAQGLTQFSISGGGGDITINGFAVQNQTTGLADISLSPTASLGTRTITMSTAGEVVSLNQGFLVTGGIPSLISISPSTYKQCDTNVNVQIAGVFTKWLSGPTSVTMGANINVASVTVNSDTALTAVINVPCGTPIGLQSITVQGPASISGGPNTVVGLPGQVQVISNAPPTPYISYETPGVALKGQTLTVYLYGQFTHWLPVGDPNATTITFGAGITVNNFQVTGLTSAAANITIQPTANVGSRTVIMTTGGTEVETTSFYVTVGTPAISLVDGPNGSQGIQGQTLTVNLVGGYTTWDATMNESNFNFGQGITVVPGTFQIFGPTAVRMNITVAINAFLGGRTVTATHAVPGGTETAYGFFSVTPSTATINTVIPNTAMQGTQGFVTHVVGFNTHWDNTTSFSFGGGDVGVAQINVIDATHADVTLNLVPLASPGLRNVVAQTVGEIATLVNGFVVTPGTPILTNCVSCGSNAVIQQNTFHISILGQFTAFDATTTVDLGNGLIINPGVGVNDNTKGIDITGPQSIDVTGHVDPLAYMGCRDVTVTTGGTQVLKLYGAVCVGQGPAVISLLNPNHGLQGTTFNVDITGTNSNFCCVNPPNITVGNFGQGISLNTLTVHSATSATANITIAANAFSQQNSVTLTTQGEIATIPLAFTIQNNTPVVSFVSPNSGAQGATAFDVTVQGTFTHWQLGQTSANFGTGITANVTAVPDNTHATVHVTISPIATTGNHVLQMVTNLGGGGQEIALYTINNAQAFFGVTAGPAAITAVNPVTPASVHQNDSGDIVQIVGSATHFTLATPAVNFPCIGAPAAIQVIDDTHLNATINVGAFAQTGACNVSVTTGGEVASGTGLLNIQPGIPVITNVSANQAHQGDTLSINISGLYTHFLSGFTCAFCGNANVTVNTHTANSDTSLTLNITINPATATGAMDVTVQDPTDGPLTDHNAFTILAGVPTLQSISIPNGPQGLTQNEHLVGLFTHWSNSSVVSVSGTGVTVGNPPSSPDATDLNVSFQVALGAPAGPRTVSVQTGSEFVSLPNAFTVQPGSPNVSVLTPNIGAPNSTVTVHLTGVFTNWTNGATTANFGPGIGVNGGALGAANVITVSDATDAVAQLTIDSSAALGPRNVVINTPAPPLAAAEMITVTNGFTVQAAPGPLVITTLTPSMGLSGTVQASNVPTNTQIVVTFNEPIDPATATPATAMLTDGTTQGCYQSSGLPTTVTTDVSGRFITITPTSLLGVGRTFYLTLNSSNRPGGSPTLKDASDTQNLQTNLCYAFSTGFSQDPVGPTFLTGSIPNNATGVPLNIHPILGFDKPVSPASISGLTFTQGGSAVAGNWSYTSDYTQYTFTPSANLAATTTYVVTYTSALTDAAGYPLTNPGTLTFTTGTTTDTSGPSAVSITPVYNSTVGTGPTFRLIASEPMNPLAFNDVYAWNYTNGGPNPSSSLFTGTLTWSADYKTFTYTLAQPLPASTQFYWHMCSGRDMAGNSGICFNQFFYTGTGPDSTPPSVTKISPPDTTTNVAVNAPVWVQFSEQLDPTMLPANAITLTPGPVAGTVTFNGSDYSTLIFTPSANLATSTTYHVAVSGLIDPSGNPMTPFAGSSFITSSSATADTTHGTVTITPSSGSTVPVNTNVVFQLSKPVNPTTINSLSMRVYDNTIGKDIPGTVAVSSDLKTLTFTPSTACSSAAHCLPANHTVCTWNGNGAYLYDIDGLNFNFTGLCFSTNNTSDTTLPMVISVTPPDSSTGIGPTNPVVVTFNKPLNPGTIQNNVAVYTGSSLYTPNYSLSQDATTISFNVGTLPYSTTFTVVAGVNVTDLQGNHPAAESRTSFTTAPQPVNTRPSVSAVRPGNGATGVPANSAITFFTNAAMDPTTVTANSVHVSQNGTLLNGAVSLAANNEAITFVPAVQFTAGALVQVWFTSAAKDTAGNPLFDYFSSFTVAPSACTAPTVTAYSAGRYNSGLTPNYINNSVVEVQFCEAINPATVTSASFNVRANSSTPGSGNPIPGNITFDNNNSLIRFTPASDYNLGNYIAVQLTTAIQDVAAHPFAGDGFWVYIQGAATHDATAPFVSAMAPTNGSTGIGSNAVVSVTFSEDVDPLTLIANNVTLTGPGGPIPVSVSYNSNNLTMTVTPQAPMPAGVVTLQLNNVADYAGNVLNPSPFSSSFTVMNGADFSGPSVVLTSWVNGQSNLPLNSSFSITFNKPIDLRSANYGQNGSVRLWDCSISCGTTIPGTISWSGGNTVLLITPTGLLNVGHDYRIFVTGLSDLNGNGSSTLVNSDVYTALAAPPGGPQITNFITPNGFTNVPENFKPQIQFDRAIQGTSLSGVTMVKMPGSVPVGFSAQLSASGTLLTLVPNTILLPAVQYQVTVAGVQDAAGNTMAGSVTHSFTTGPAIDLVAPSVVSVTPVYNATVGTNPLLKMTFNEPINPISATNFAMYDLGTSRYVNQVTTTWAADLKSVIFNYPGPLDPNDRFYFYMNSFADLAGNTNNSGTQYFYTSSSVDNTPLTVITVNPPNGATGVPINPAIAIQFNKPVAPTSISNSSLTVAGVPGTTVSLSSDGMTLSSILPANLTGNVTYTINASGFTDGSGNAVTPFSSSFTTSNTALSDTSHGGVSLTTPPPGATGVPLNQVVTVTFSKPFDPVTLVQDSFVVCYANNCNNRISGTVAIVDANHLSFTPAGNMPPSTVLGVFVYPFTSYVTDLAGNHFDNPYLYNAQFTTAAVTDNTVPTVIGQSPANGATGVGPNPTVSLTFNKSLNQNTVNGNNFALYNGPNNLGANVSISSDRRTVYLSQTLPWNSTITVTANTNVQDYSGNSMSVPYSASFTTKAQPLNFNPSVIQFRPGSGAPLNSAITMYTNSQINLSTAQNGVQVAQNGALIPGTVSLTADQHGIVWTPNSSYLPAAFIEVWATSSITDLNNNALNSYYTNFTTTAASCTTPTITAYPIGRFTGSSAMNYITNPVIDVQFCGPLNPATVNSSSVFLCPNTSSPGCAPASRVNGTISLLANNTIVRFKPAVDLNLSNYVNIQYANTIQDAGGHNFAGDQFWIYIQNTAVHDNTPVSVSAVTPVNNAPGIGDNAPVRIAFNKTIDTVTANPLSVTLNGGTIPYTYSFNSPGTVMNITPLSPLPDSSTINVDVSAGVSDLTGASLTDFPFSFQTKAGADFTGPTMIQRSIDDNERTNVPVNTTFTMIFDKPLDPTTVIGNPTGGNTSGFFYYDSTCPSGQCYPPSTVNLSADLKTVTIIPSAPLTSSSSTMYYYWRGATDLNGNGITNQSQQYFTTASSIDTTPPTVIGSNPVNGFTNAPTNTVIEVMFNKAVRATSLSHFTLNGSPVTAALNSSVYTTDQVVELVPPALLLPNTVYTVVAQGVQDVAGNTLAAPFSFSFTTGPNFSTNSPNFLGTATVTTTGGTVALPQNTSVVNVLKTNPVFTFAWDTPIDLGTFIIPNSAITLTDTSNTPINVPLNCVLSADQKTVTVTVNGTLTGNTNYRIWIRLQGVPYSVSGYYDNSQRMFPFTTQP